ncbi:hypothetical protein C0995_003106 [Termitomyces sp. Mi166|nr:hypothetical protein C0995_003106 [Termitomyces sp. Mi166\
MSPDFLANYELRGEPELTFSHMFVMDGNNLLKHIKAIGMPQIADTQCFDQSNYFLSSDFVDKYINEVKA